MNTLEQKKAAAKFAEFWADKGDEKQETSRFWIQLLGEVLGVENPTERIEFEKRVQLSHTSYIDAYIPETKVLIEQKGAKIDLHKAYPQSDGTPLTPFQQAKRYADEMRHSMRPRWIVVCNFQEILVYDLETPHADPQQIFLRDLEKEYYRLQFIVDSGNDQIRREEEISLKAGELVGKLYDALIKEYIDPDENSLRSLNILCVRIVFCLYAEDAGLFETRTTFEDYIKSFTVDNLRDGIIKLFKALDTPLEKRDKYDLKIKAFPYVNGGLFADQSIEIPNFTEEIVNVLVNHCAPFDWADISPTIFGAVFESTLNPETRRKGGMHYTSVENIHKVIDPLFMDNLNAEYKSIEEAAQMPSLRRQRLHEFQKKLGSLKFLDPACGSGNFLTETYLSLRRLENKVISALNKGEKVLGLDFFIEVKINQFYGIEINDFAVTVAKTALWIAESQMMAETEAILGQELDFLPLTTNAFIVEGNALRMDWATLKPTNENATSSEGLFSGFTTEIDGEKHEYDYIIGNPPFVGARLMSESQKKDLLDVFGKTKNAGNLDYVSCWYQRSVELMKDTSAKAALVSTNSISQGEHVAILWKTLFEQGISIDFAWRTFRWDSESSEKAHVHCVIVGFSCRNTSLGVSPQPTKRIFTEDGETIIAQNINGYLLNAPNAFAESRKKPICKVSEMVFGSMPNDNGNLIISANEYDDFLKKEPLAKPYIREFLGAEEFINGKKRYCLWLKGISPNELRKMPQVMKRIEAVKHLRESSSREATRKLADMPHLFGEIRQPESGNYLLVPRVSSERRQYVPMGYLPSDIIASDATQIVPNATLYEFGVLTSNVHNAWMRAVCGRLKSDYRYSNTIVYNNFPWPSAVVEPVETTGHFDKLNELKTKIEQTAQAILDARALYPKASLADLYDELSMPPELRRAHRDNDRAVMEAYGFNPKMTENEMVAELFKMYERLTNKE